VQLDIATPEIVAVISEERFPRRTGPQIVDPAQQDAIRATLPELPEAKRRRLIAEYGLSEGDAATLTATRLSR